MGRWLRSGHAVCGQWDSGPGLGANVIPPIFRCAEGRWSRVIGDAAAHMNNIRIWGGAHYGEEVLRDPKYQNGILVWQDFMNACHGAESTSPWRPTWRKPGNKGPVGGTGRHWPSGRATMTEKVWREWGCRTPRTCRGRIPLRSKTRMPVVERNCWSWWLSLGANTNRLHHTIKRPTVPVNRETSTIGASGSERRTSSTLRKPVFRQRIRAAGLPDRRTGSGWCSVLRGHGPSSDNAAR